MKPEWYGLFSPAFSSEEEEEDERRIDQHGDHPQQIGLPSEIKSFSQQIRYLNENLFLPHKQNGEKSDFLSDQIFVCKVNSDDRIRVTDRIVLFPTTKDTRYDRFPLLMSEKTAKDRVLALFQEAVSIICFDNNHQRAPIEDDDDDGEYFSSVLDLFDLEDRIDLVGTFVGLLALVSKLTGVLTEKTKHWLLRNQDKLNIDLVEKINKTLEEAAKRSSSSEIQRDSINEEHCQLMLRYLMKNLSDFYELLHIKPIGTVVCLIETTQNYATFEDFVQIKLQTF